MTPAAPSRMLGLLASRGASGVARTARTSWTAPAHPRLNRRARVALPGTPGAKGGERALRGWAGQAVWRRAGLVLGVLLALAGLWWALSSAGLLDLLSNRDALSREVARLGPFGPAAVVLGIAAAVVASPIPSAPIALAAGAVFGKLWGSVYVVAGAELGAVAAFLLARRFGYGPARRVPWLGRLLDRTRSQWLLACIVLASRLVPFVSFDAVSYAAGLTPLRLPWFALATLLGVAPVSVALVWFGETLVEQGSDWVLWAVLALGFVTGLPVAWRLLRARA